MEVNRLNSVQKATNLKKKSKVGTNEMFNNCLDSYRPVIIGFVQYQHSSVQLVVKKMDRYTIFRTTLAAMDILQQSSPLGDHKYRSDPLS